MKPTDYAFALWFVSVTLIIGVLTLPAPILSRRAGWGIAKFWCRLILTGQSILCGTTSKIENCNKIPEGPAIIAANHQSPWDMIALALTVPKPTFIVKKELFFIPVFGWWIKALGNVGIDRSKGKISMSEILAAAPEIFTQGRQLVIFPEGTRARNGKTQRFASGVGRIYVACNVPCIPFAHNSGYLWSRSGFKLQSGQITGRYLDAIMPGQDLKSFMVGLEDNIRKNIEPHSYTNVNESIASHL